MGNYENPRDQQANHDKIFSAQAARATQASPLHV